MIVRLISIFSICALATGCATKSLKVTAPSVGQPTQVVRYVKIENVVDSRVFAVAPTNPAVPSIEGDYIHDKKITDKSIGRMRHGMFHNALWNYTLTGNENIYSVCERIASNSLRAAGYSVVGKDSPEYDTALPVSVEVVQFWAWMQPKFNIDLNFDGELVVKSADNSVAATGKGSSFISTAIASGGVWTKLVNQGVEQLQANLTKELKSKH